MTINEDEDGLCEVFTTIGKAGGNAAAQSEAISRLISLALRSGIEPREIMKQLKGISGPTPVWDGHGGQILSTPDLIGEVLERYVENREQVLALRRAQHIKGSVLVLNGGADPSVKPADVQAFQEAMEKYGVDWQLVNYGGAVHGLTNAANGADPSDGLAYQEKADRRSWEAMKGFLEETIARGRR